MPQFSNLQQLPGLTFTSGSSDRVSFGTITAWSGLTTLSALMLVQNGTGTDGRFLFAKSNISSFVRGYRLITSGTTGNVQFTGVNATTNVSYITNDTPMAWGGLGQRWKWVAVVFDSVNAPNVRIYTAKRGVGLRESTYGTTTDGVGAYTVDTGADNLIIGNDSGFGGALNGSVSVFAFWNDLKDLNFLESVREAFDGGAPFGPLPSAQIYAALGAEGGSTVLNRANPGSTNGTITGTKRGTGPFIPMRYRPTAIRVLVAPATKLVMVVQPQNTVVGQTMATITVKATDAVGTTDTNYTTNCVLAWGTNPNSAPAPAGTLTKAMVAGVVSFTDILVNTLQTNATFTITSGSITSVTTSTFSITAPAASTAPDPFGEGSLLLV